MTFPVYNELCIQPIYRSKKETERLHRMHKPARAPIKNDLPSLESDDEGDDGEEWSSGVELSEDDVDSKDLSDEEDDEDDGSSTGSQVSHRKRLKQPVSDEEEMPYESMPRRRRPSWDAESDNDKVVKRLPIKHSDGRIEESRAKVFLPNEEESSEDESEIESSPVIESSRVEDVSTGARFGRPAVVDVVGNKSRKVRIQTAKEQIAGICQEIVADPENSVRERLSN